MDAQLTGYARKSEKDGLATLEAEVLAYPGVAALAPPGRGGEDAAPALLVSFVLDLPLGPVSLFSTLTTFGNPRDVTLDELCVEFFYPNDAESESLLRAAVVPPR